MFFSAIISCTDMHGDFQSDCNRVRCALWLFLHVSLCTFLCYVYEIPWTAIIQRTYRHCFQHGEHTHTQNSQHKFDLNWYWRRCVPYTALFESHMMIWGRAITWHLISDATTFQKNNISCQSNQNRFDLAKIWNIQFLTTLPIRPHLTLFEWYLIFKAIQAVTHPFKNSSSRWDGHSHEKWRIQSSWCMDAKSSLSCGFDKFQISPSGYQ